MQRILFIATNSSSPWGGSEQLWFETALHFLENRYEVAVCIKKWPKLPDRFSAFQKYPHFTYIFRQQYPRFLQRVYNRLSPARFRRTKTDGFKKAILAWQPSLVIVSQGDNVAGIDMMLFCIDHQLPYISISQAVIESKWPADAVCANMRTCFNAAVQNYFVSQANLHTTSLQAGQWLTNASVIRNPFNVPYHNDIPFPSTESGFCIASVARYDFVAKGQDILLQVLDQQKWRERNVTVNLYGHGMNEQGLRWLIQLLDLKNVVIRGFEDTTRIWEQNHALVIASRYEGLPLALVEAMLCERIAIVTDVSGNKEVLSDNMNGFVAAAATVSALDEALERAWLRKDEWKEMGIAAKKHIRQLVPEDPSKVFYEAIAALLQVNRFEV
jgi:glycosyltransferase involved in cell wall biosynthesis